MWASCFFARSRKRGKSPLPTSPAPSQEKITNCGGACPGSNGTGLPGWWGCFPVKEVEPSPMGRAVGFGEGLASEPLEGWDTPPDPSDPVRVPHPDSPAAAAAPAPSPSAPLRLRVGMLPRFITFLGGHPVRGDEEGGGFRHYLRIR